VTSDEFFFQKLVVDIPLPRISSMPLYRACVDLPSPGRDSVDAGRSPISIVLSHDCLGWPGLRLQSAGGSVMQACLGVLIRFFVLKASVRD